MNNSSTRREQTQGEMYLNRHALADVTRVARRHWSFRRVMTLSGYALGLLLLRGVGRVARFIDDRLWPEIAHQPIDQPVFLFANARSGTTFLHRLMSLDEDRFAHFKLYQSILWSVSAQRVVDALDRADRRFLGRRLRRLVDWINDSFFHSWEGIHDMGIDRAEEDEAIFALCLNTPAISLLLPWMDELPSVRWFDQLDADERDRFLDVYADAIRRHLFSVGGNRIFLNKNALFAPRIRSIYRRFPDARFIYMIRHPYESIPSFLNMFHAKWVTHSPEIPKDSPESRALARLAIEYLLYALECRKLIPADQLLIVRYEDLVSRPLATVDRIYGWLGMPIDQVFRRRLEETLAVQRSYLSHHEYDLEDFGLSREDIHVELKSVFDEFGFEP